MCAKYQQPASLAQLKRWKHGETANLALVKSMHIHDMILVSLTYTHIKCHSQ